MYLFHLYVIRKSVALLAEGVDRNSNIRKILAMLDKVALLAEGVDRNTVLPPLLLLPQLSPSSRRAWIEIELHSPTNTTS